MSRARTFSLRLTRARTYTTSQASAASSLSSNHKLWAAKFVARHPNLLSVELSNFKCGHDAFISRTIEEIIERSGKPHFSFRDLDENRPLASIRIRVETMHYFLKNYKETLKPGLG